MTDGSAKDLIPLAKSWINSPALKVLKGAAAAPLYDPAERAYVMSLTKLESKKPLYLRLESTPGKPAVNPAIVVGG